MVVGKNGNTVSCIMVRMVAGRNGAQLVGMVAGLVGMVGEW